MYSKFEDLSISRKLIIICLLSMLPITMFTAWVISAQEQKILSKEIENNIQSHLRRLESNVLREINAYQDIVNPLAEAMSSAGFLSENQNALQNTVLRPYANLNAEINYFAVVSSAGAIESVELNRGRFSGAEISNESPAVGNDFPVNIFSSTLGVAYQSKAGDMLLRSLGMENARSMLFFSAITEGELASRWLVISIDYQKLMTRLIDEKLNAIGQDRNSVLGLYLIDAGKNFFAGEHVGVNAKDLRRREFSVGGEKFDLVMEFDSKMLGSPYRVQRNILLISLLTLVVIIALTLTFSVRWMILKPVSALSAAAVAFSKGEKYVKVDYERKDEIGRLTRIFNAMNAEISQAHIFLERKVKVKTEQATAAAKKIQTILDTVGEAIISIDSSGVITSFNAAAEKVFGYKEEEVLGENVAILMPENIAEHHGQYLNKSTLQEKSQIFGKERVLEATRKNGEVFPISLVVTRSDDENNRVITGVIVDLSEKIEQERKLAEKEALIQAAIDASVQPFLLIDNEARIVEVNQSACRWLGYTGEELLKSKFMQLIAESSSTWTRSVFSSLKNGERDRAVGEVLFLHHGGKIFWGLLSISPVKKYDGTVHIYVVQVTDIQLLKSLEESMERKNAELLKSNEDLDQFAYVASHDLKSPLNAIIKIVSWIEEDCEDLLPKDSKDHLELLRSRTLRMMKLLDDLLDYSRIGRKQFDKGVVNLEEMATEMFTFMDKPEAFSLKVEPTILSVPQTPFELVIRNLLSNAIKHHDRVDGLISISCEYESGCYCVSVEDDGPGIPSNMHLKVMEMFQTLKPRDQVEGSGMGLAMVKKTIEHYGGQLSVHSDGKRGCRFSFTWPINAPTET